MQIKEKENRVNNIILQNIPECESKDPAERKIYDIDIFYNVATALLGNTADVEAV